MRSVQIINKLAEFAEKYNLLLETKGIVDGGKQCVGFKQKGRFIGINPTNLRGEKINDSDERLSPPNGVKSHPQRFLVYKGTANQTRTLFNLLRWCEKLERNGYLELVEYKTKAVDIERRLYGTHAILIRYRRKDERLFGVEAKTEDKSQYQ